MILRIIKVWVFFLSEMGVDEVVVMMWNLNATCGQHKKEIRRQLRMLAKPEPHVYFGSGSIRSFDSLSQYSPFEQIFPAKMEFPRKPLRLWTSNRTLMVYVPLVIIRTR